MRLDRIVVALLVVALTMSGCGGPPSGSAEACSSDEQCRPDARCTSGGCIANSAPQAAFTVAGSLESGALVTLDGSDSYDPDEGDGITSYTWRIEPESAPCPAPEVASGDPVVKVRFGCGGTFQARLIVLDGKLQESTPAARALEIKERSSPSLVEAGADQAVDHLCSGTPLVCRLATPVKLSAKISTQASVSFRWSVQPPLGLPLDEHRRVRFLPDAHAQNPTVEFETDGTAISGDWKLLVEVRDALGVLDKDVMRLSVKNHPPVINGHPDASYDHAYVAATRLFTASGTFPLKVVDEDGDPVERQVRFHHLGDDGAAFLGEDLGSSIRFSVAVPRTTRDDAQLLIGAPGLERSIAVTAVDVNRAAAVATFPIVIGNREPVQVAAPERRPRHWYDAASRLYLSEPSLGIWFDPDGDPLTSEVKADPECPTFSADADGRVRVQCARPFDGVASLSGFLRDRKAQVVVRDPWTAATSAVSFRIANRTPTAGTSSFSASVGCCKEPGRCPGTGSGWDPANHYFSATLYVPVAASDPDGDPLEVRPSTYGLPASCSPGTDCTMTVLFPDTIVCGGFVLGVPFTTTDGAATSTGSVTVRPACR